MHGGADGEIVARVERGGTLSSNRGINLPGRRVSLPSLTDKDEADIDLAVALGFDFLALSFVQVGRGRARLQRRLAARGADIPVIAKIEKKSALDDIAAIAEAAYGVMVARGDLALEMSLPEVPIAQKRIIAACRQAACPVITATQMLESMTHAPKPTRAEATDVANAIFDGTDAVMLSGESAMGEFPVETVAMMSAIAARAEAAWHDGEVPCPPSLRGNDRAGRRRRARRQGHRRPRSTPARSSRTRPAARRRGGWPVTGPACRCWRCARTNASGGG